MWTERKQSGCQGLLGRHCVQSLSFLWYWDWGQELAEDTEWATHQGKIYSTNVYYILLHFMEICHPFLSPHSQTAQDISFANVQGLFQSLSSRRGCPTTSPSTRVDEKSVTTNGKGSMSFWVFMRSLPCKACLDSIALIFIYPAQTWCLWMGSLSPSCLWTHFTSWHKNRNTPTASTLFTSLSGETFFLLPIYSTNLILAFFVSVSSQP